MRNKPVSIPRQKPRNRVVLALSMLLSRGSGRHASTKRPQDAARRDLAQRVRELGEW